MPLFKHFQFLVILYFSSGPCLCFGLHFEQILGFDLCLPLHTLYWSLFLINITVQHHKAHWMMHYSCKYLLFSLSFTLGIFFLLHVQKISKWFYIIMKVVHYSFCVTHHCQTTAQMEEQRGSCLRRSIIWP